MPLPRVLAGIKSVPVHNLRCVLEQEAVIRQFLLRISPRTTSNLVVQSRVIYQNRISAPEVAFDHAIFECFCFCILNLMHQTIHVLNPTMQIEVVQILVEVVCLFRQQRHWLVPLAILEPVE